jgi:nucleoside-diphosphate-sugar epimerase
MKALVTGHLGFIGGEVCRALDSAGYETYGMDVAGGLDIRQVLRHDEYRHDVVVHCAAVVGGRKVMDWTPVEHAANLAIDAELFRWAARVKPGRIVYFSSSCAYPVALGTAGQRLREADIDLHRPQWPDQLYGWTKLTGELLAQTVAGEGIPVTVVRPFSVYGPGMNDGFAVRGFAEQVARRADPVEIWGDDRQTRDYIHVRDVAAAVLAAVREGVDGPVNLGTGRATSLHDLAVMMAGIAGYQPQIKIAEDMPAGVPWLVANPARLRSFYEPRVSLETGLAEVLACST